MTTVPTSKDSVTSKSGAIEFGPPPAPPDNVADRLEDNQLRASSDLQLALALASNAQAFRLAAAEQGVSRKVTRTTALVGASVADSQVQQLAKDAQLDWKVFLDGADLTDWTPPADLKPQRDAAFHDIALRAIDAYAKSFGASRPVLDSLGLAWALVTVETGRFHERLSDAGARPEQFESLLHRAIEAPESLVQPDTLDLSSRVVSDMPSAVDLLDISPLVQALDALLSHKETTLPIAIGITAPWGGGKSSVMRQLEVALLDPDGRPYNAEGRRTPAALRRKNRDRSWYTVSFDAWKYERGERIWAALAKAIYEQPQKQMSLWGRVRFRVNLELKRRTPWGFWSKLVVPLLLALAAAAAVIVGEFTEIASIGVVTFVVTALAAVGRYWGLLSDPFKRAMDSYASRQDFEDQLGFTFEADSEIGALAEVLTGDDRAVAILVDDLDRCRTDHVVDVVEAINQIFNAAEDRRFAFIIGMDPDMVASNLDNAYRDVIERLKSRDKERGERFGESFLSKIVQLTIALPEPQPEAMSSLLDHITRAPDAGDERTSGPDPADVRNLEAMITAQDPQNPEDVEKIRVAIEELGEDTEVLDISGLDLAVRRIRATTFSHDSPSVREAEKAALPLLRANPRALKRFDNAFRLQLHVANGSADCELTFSKAELVALARWVALRLEYPEVFRAVGTDSERLDTLARAAAGEKDALKVLADRKTYPASVSSDAVLAFFRASSDEQLIHQLPLDTFLTVT